jgi:hypothetical protein
MPGRGQGSGPRFSVPVGFQKLPKAEQQLDAWQAAVETLLSVVEDNEPSMMARCIMAAHIEGKKTSRSGHAILALTSPRALDRR